jgi:carbonic anhydrase/acetyltransferase-like protein (isoleucine patch superfamily)
VGPAAREADVEADMKKRTSRNPPAGRQGPEWNRRFSLPFEESVEGEAQVHYAAELDRCVIISPNGDVVIGAAHLSQCVIVAPCHIADGVKAVAAILQGVIGEGCHIEAHADIQGTLMEDVVIGRGVKIEHGAMVGEGSNIGDLTVVHEGAEIGSEVVVGAQSDIGEEAFVHDGGRLPARSVMRPRTYLEVPADTRQGPAGEPRTQLQIVPEMSDEESDEESEDVGVDDDDYEGSWSREADRSDWQPPALSRGPTAKPGDMARGQPHLLLGDFQPGTARSWVLSKLGRIANLKSKDGRLTKKLVQEWRPDLLEHPVTKEVLRITPPVTDQQLAAMSFESLSKARYDVYGGISFHSGADRAWQMLGPKANDVFVFAVPDSVIEKDLVPSEPPPLAWHGRVYETVTPNGRGAETFGEVVLNEDDRRPERWLAYVFPGGFSSNEEADNYGYFDDLEDAKQHVEEWTRKRFLDGVAHGRRSIDAAFTEATGWHPDRGVKHPVGWVRLLVYPRQTVVVVEIQSDQSWMKFNWKEPPWKGTVEGMLRAVYFDSFAADALNFVVEWAFNNRYGEVVVLDYASRQQLGGTPPKSFYDDLPKKYTVSQPVPLISGPMDYIRLYDWVPRDLKVRRIIPNKRARR